MTEAEGKTVLTSWIAWVMPSLFGGYLFNMPSTVFWSTFWHKVAEVVGTGQLDSLPVVSSGGKGISRALFMVSPMYSKSSRETSSSCRLFLLVREFKPISRNLLIRASNMAAKLLPIAAASSALRTFEVRAFLI